jgi:hypothetical protein
MVRRIGVAFHQNPRFCAEHIRENHQKAKPNMLICAESNPTCNS